MARLELRRFVYMCDGLEQSNRKCRGAQVIEAACESDADKICRERGWSNDRFGRWVCGQFKHAKSVHTHNDDEDQEMQHLVHVVGKCAEDEGGCQIRDHYQWQ